MTIKTNVELVLLVVGFNQSNCSIFPADQTQSKKFPQFYAVTSWEICVSMKVAIIK